ncbi:unnamed protein product, partial [Prorocentrum cordatum]
ELLRHCEGALAPRVDSLATFGAMAVVTVRLGRALRRRLYAGLSREAAGSGRWVLQEVGVGPTRVRVGWLFAGLDERADPRTCALQFVDVAGEARAALERHAGRVTRLPEPEEGVGAAQAPYSLLGALSSLAGTLGVALPWQRDAAGPPRQAAVAEERAAAMRDEARRALVPMLQRLQGMQAKKEEQDTSEDDVSRAYKSVKDFKVLARGDPAFVDMSDLRGCPEIRKKLAELVEVVRNPERFRKVGATPPKGVLFCGEPGTGKTYAARAVASAAGVPFLAVSGSDFRQSPFSGVGTSMTLRMFDEARKRAPCIIFVDEIDSLGVARRQGPTAFQDAGEMGGSVTRDQDSNLNALLAKMDGFQPSSGVLFLAATNRPEVLDEALLRTGRFDQRVEFKLPDAAGRAEILEAAARALVFEQPPDFEALAAQTPAFSPADLQGVLNSAAMDAAYAGLDAIAAPAVEKSVQEVRSRKAKAKPEGQFQVTQCVDVTFRDVRGHDEAVEELRDLVDALRHPERYEAVGAVAPRGVLLEGPPGVGKTHCARALAGEVGLPFLSASGSDFQASRYAGQGTQLVKRLFTLARKLQPCILFIDEVDALGRRRSGAAAGAEQDRENTMMQLLVEMDGFEERSQTLVLAATNRADVLDPALLRPGRFDRRVALELPDQAGRRALLDLYAGRLLGSRCGAGLSLWCAVLIERGDPLQTVQNLVNEAALLAVKRRLERISRDCVACAADRIALGAEKANPMRSEAARRLTAVHEAGHAVLGMALEGLTFRRLARASIRPRTGGIGGVTVFEPLAEGTEGSLPAGIQTRQGALASLCVELGGRVAEEALLRPSEVSSGASADLRSATRRAMAMAAEWGLAGPVLSLEGLGRCSEATLSRAEQAAGAVLAQALASARALLGGPAGRRCLEFATARLLEQDQGRPRPRPWRPPGRTCGCCGRRPCARRAGGVPRSRRRRPPRRCSRGSRDGRSRLPPPSPP